MKQIQICAGLHVFRIHNLRVFFERSEKQLSKDTAMTSNYPKEEKSFNISLLYILIGHQSYILRNNYLPWPVSEIKEQSKLGWCYGKNLGVTTEEAQNKNKAMSPQRHNIIILLDKTRWIICMDLRSIRRMVRPHVA